MLDEHPRVGHGRALDAEVADPRPETIIDPDNGDIIGHIPGRELGRVRVARVHTGYSLADIIIGRTQDFKIGQLCRKLEYVAAR
ncbi:MAG TPA: hypothetical protein VMZ50_08720 [Phycisphaerae bacterium]|nr:hypothetical protein [Phycisphaerae bacterium]